MVISHKIFRALLLVIFLFCITNCEERDSNNPFDENCPKELFTPSDFNAEQQGNRIILSWKQTNTNISGFIISRNENDGTLNEVARVGKNDTIWIDNDFSGGKKYGYQLVAYAAENLSNPQSVTITTFLVIIVTTSSALEATSNSAVLGGSVTSEDGSTVTDKGLCYSTSQNPTIESNRITMGNGNGSFSTKVAGLASNTTYFVRAYAISSDGNTTYGDQISFTTPELLFLTATTYEADNVANISASLNGIVNANGQSTTVIFEYGTTTSYGSEVTAIQSPVTGNTNTIVSAEVIDLVPNTEFHFRVKAVNAEETAYGSDLTLKTKELLVPDGLLAYYPFNGNAYDESGNSRHGTPLNITYGPGRSGKPNTTAQFYGNGFIRVKGLGQTNSFSIALWYKTTQDGFILSCEDIWFFTNITENYFAAFWNDSGGTYVAGGNPVYGDDTWHHVVATHDGDDERIVTYFDGEVGHNRPNSGYFRGDSSDIYIGFDFRESGWGSNIPDFVGSLDDIYLYDRALDFFEVKLLFVNND